MNIQFSIFDTFLAVSEEKSMTKAASRVGLTQAAVTKQMQTLEQSLGLELFEKNRTPKRLNDNGKAFRKLALMYTAAIEKFKADHLASPDSLNGELFICCSQCNSTLPLVNLLASFESMYPGVRIYIQNKDYRQLFHEFSNGMFVIVPESEVIPGARQLLILNSISLGVAVPKGIPLANKARITIDDIANYRLIMTEEMQANTAISTWLNGKTPNTICDDYLVTQNMINNGGGISILPTCYINYISDSYFKIIPMYPSINIGIKIMYLGYDAMSLTETTFLNYITKNLK